MLKTCKCCHTEYETTYQKSVYCSEPCRVFFQTVGNKLPQEMLEDAAVLSSEEDYKLFVRSYFYMKNGKLNYQLLTSELLPVFLKVNPLKFADIHNNEDSVNHKVLRWLYDVNPEGCITCGKSTSLEIKKSIPSYRKYCCEDCYTKSMKVGGEARKVLQQVVMDKHGVDNVFRLDSVKLKSKETNLVKYGVEFAMQSDEVKQLHQESMLKLHGVRFSLQSKEIKAKVHKSLGATTWYATQEAQAAREKAFEKFEGGHPLRDPSVIETIRQNNIKKYGVSSFLLTKECSEALTASNIKRYGVPHVLMNRDVWIKVRSAVSFVSKPEKEISNWLTSLGVNHRVSDFTVLNNIKCEDGANRRQIDIYCPDHKLAIEFNGLYWHSEEKKYHRYHLEKTNGCESKGIQLVHIWEDEWREKPEVVKGLLAAKLGITKPKTYARKCVVVEGKKAETVNFLDKLHIQGSVNSASHYLLLKDKATGDVRAVMLFIKRIVDGQLCMELVRFASDGCHGAFSKLLTYYKIHLQKGLVTYSFGDRCVVSRLNNVYLRNGFVETKILPPDYKYIDRNMKVRQHKFGFRKSEFEKMGYDITNKTESELATEAGLVRIWGCGLIRYELAFNKQTAV